MQGFSVDDVQLVFLEVGFNQLTFKSIVLKTGIV